MKNVLTEILYNAEQKVPAVWPSRPELYLFPTYIVMLAKVCALFYSRW